MYLRAHIRTRKGQLLFHLKRLAHLCKICKLINWLQVIVSSSPQNISLCGTVPPTQMMLRRPRGPPASVLCQPSPLLPLLLLQAKDQNCNFWWPCHQPPATWSCASSVGANRPGIFRVGWRAGRAPCDLQPLLWYQMMLWHQEKATAFSPP